ncbi:HEAT repeat domain-containing protein [Lentisphaera marina]|uniref:HEAT repeat domain-containing protein n=1 Tax=Lentisphaera marina TaxID=1111041 RepID=UPI002366E427|nr:HEAT repeat domain-containing protein [Lentisphaera marina]MDD7987354.1 HEAT repeat domain-containing protein [Lentisphaera marina]
MSEIHDKYKSDKRSSRQLAEEYRAAIEPHQPIKMIATIHYRGGQEEFDLGVEYTKSPDPWDRVLGADILGQLGWGKQTFLEESVDILIGLLGDDHTDVISAAAVALGHRNDARAIPHLVKLVHHEDVRYGVVFGLLYYEEPEAVQAMIHLCQDKDEDVRNWALFGIGSQIELDTPDIRLALFKGLNDAHDEARGEALVGLAVRGDQRVVKALLKEWERDDIGRLSLEAAEAIANPLLLPNLQRFHETLDLDDDPHYKQTLEDAIKACDNLCG